MNELTPREGQGLSRRSFLKSVGTSAALAATAQAGAVARELAPGDAEKTYGPEAVPITLTVNDRPLKLQVEPRVTLLEALREHAPLTGAKEVCDRATCGACTVLLDGTPVYSVLDAGDRSAGPRDHHHRGPGQGRQALPRSSGPLWTKTRPCAAIARRASC